MWLRVKIQENIHGNGIGQKKSPDTGFFPRGDQTSIFCQGGRKLNFKQCQCKKISVYMDLRMHVMGGENFLTELKKVF